MHNKVHLQIENGRITDIVINNIRLYGVKKVSIISMGTQPLSHLSIEMDAEIYAGLDSENKYDTSYVYGKERRNDDE